MSMKEMASVAVASGRLGSAVAEALNVFPGRIEWYAQNVGPKGY